MHRTALIAIFLAATGAGAALAQSGSSWTVEGSRQAPPFRLVLPNAGTGISYVFDCSGPQLLVTETGVTELLDMTAKDNKRAPDTGEARVFPPNSALMAVATGAGDPNFVMGSAVANPVKGWDITISLPRDDKSFRALPHAKTAILFTTGFTAAIALNDADRKVISGFVDACGK